MEFIAYICPRCSTFKELSGILQRNEMITIEKKISLQMKTQYNRVKHSLLMQIYYPHLNKAGSTFPTAPNFDNKTYKRMVQLRSQKEQYLYSHDLPQLKAVSNFYNAQLMKSINADDIDTIIPTNTTKPLDRIPRTNKYKGLIEQELQKQRNIKFSKIYEQNLDQELKKQQSKIFSHSVFLFVVDTMHNKKNTCQTAYSINLQQFWFSCLRKNLKSYFDEELAQFVFPMINQITENHTQNNPFTDGISEKCESLKTKEQFQYCMKNLQEQNLDEQVLEVIRFLFVPTQLYREKLLLDLKDHINNLLKIDPSKRQKNCQNTDLVINNICKFDGQQVTDFIQIDWNTKILFASSDQEVIYQKLPLIEQVLQKFKDTNNQYNNRKKLIGIPFKPKSTLKMMVAAVEQQIKTKTQLFIEKLEQTSEQKSSNRLKKNMFKAINLVVKIVKQNNKQQQGLGGPLESIRQQLPLTLFEISLIQKEYPNYTEEEINKLSSTFNFLMNQNEYHEMKNGLEKSDQNIRFIYVHSFISDSNQFRQIELPNLKRILRAADMKLLPQYEDTQMNWSSYLRLMALIDNKHGHEYYAVFFKQYFDQDKIRWIKSQKLDELIMSIPSQQAPQSFRFLFKQLVRNWFKEMSFFRDDDDFDSDNFKNAIPHNPTIMLYILQWILGFHDHSFIKYSKHSIY